MGSQVKLLLLSALLTTMTQVQAAIPNSCLQSPIRTAVCPHLLYKKSAIAIPVLNVQKNDLVCLCLTDINKLQKSTDSAVEKIQQQVNWKQLGEYYQLQPQDILQLVRE